MISYSVEIGCMGTGGSRSGAGRLGHKRKAEHYRKLDIRSMVRARCITPRNAFGWLWRNSEGEQTASVSCEVNGGADGVTVRYQWRSPGETEWRPVDTSVKHHFLIMPLSHFIS